MKMKKQLLAGAIAGCTLFLMSFTTPTNSTTTPTVCNIFKTDTTITPEKLSQAFGVMIGNDLLEKSPIQKTDLNFADFRTELSKVMAGGTSEYTTQTAGTIINTGMKKLLELPADAERPAIAPKFSSALGYMIGTNVKKTWGEKIKPDILANAMEKTVKGENAGMDIAEAQTIVQEESMRQADKMGAKAKAEGAAFLAKNSKKAGIQTLPSGIQYEVLKKGNGAIPKATDKVKTHYHGTLIDGTIFDSSVDRGEPISFPVMGVIKGWQEVLQLMPVGSKWKVYIPYNLAYGERGTPSIPPYSTLIFEMELLDIEEDKTAELKAQAKQKEDAWMAENAKKSNVKVLSSGLQYEILKEGNGAIPKASDKVKTHYHGTLIDGTIFDSSVDRGEPISFPVMGVIKGWQEALQLMPVGSKWKVYIPFDLAYGDRAMGKIPAYSTLIFEMELLAIEGAKAPTPKKQPVPESQPELEQKPKTVKELKAELESTKKLGKANIKVLKTNLKTAKKEKKDNVAALTSELKALKEKNKAALAVLKAELKAAQKREKAAAKEAKLKAKAIAKDKVKGE